MPLHLAPCTPTTLRPLLRHTQPTTCLLGRRCRDTREWYFALFLINGNQTNAAVRKKKTNRFDASVLLFVRFSFPFRQPPKMQACYYRGRDSYQSEPLERLSERNLPMFLRELRSWRAACEMPASNRRCNALDSWRGAAVGSTRSLWIGHYAVMPAAKEGVVGWRRPYPLLALEAACAAFSRSAFSNSSCALSIFVILGFRTMPPREPGPPPRPLLVPGSAPLAPPRVEPPRPPPRLPLPPRPRLGGPSFLQRVLV
jgi:hypothetical protein